MKVKNILVEVELEGKGIVNYDSNDQKQLWNRESKRGNKNGFTGIHDNVSYAKKNYYRDEDGNLQYKVKISGDAIRNAIFKNDIVAANPSIQHHPALLNSFIGSTVGLVRGYMFANKNSTVKRKSPLTISDAEQTNNAVSYIETFSRSGGKISKTDEDAGGDTSFFLAETIGDIKYKSQGNINLADMQFMSADPIFDRHSFNADNFDLFKMFMENTLPKFDSELGYYTLNGSVVDMAEYGIKLNDENVIFLVKESLKRILSINILRNKGFAKATKLRIKLVSNPINDTITNKDGWVELSSVEDIDALSFEVEDFYVLADESKVKEQREVIEGKYAELLEAKKAEKKAKKAKK